MIPVCVKMRSMYIESLIGLYKALGRDLVHIHTCICTCICRCVTMNILK